jgi:lipid-A-disaccharide synthase-like uncharacterized protein
MTIWEVLGWTGNACFFSRFFVQWALSERAKTSVAPRVFWWLSLVGSLAIGSYSVHREQYILLVGNVLNGMIYARNLRIGATGGKRRLAVLPASVLAASAIVGLSVAASQTMRTGSDTTLLWVSVAMTGQALWSSRFVVQWWFTERSGDSHFPRVFWWISLAGNILLLAYALQLADAIYVAGFLPGPIVQLRNLMLSRTATKVIVPAAPPPTTTPGQATPSTTHESEARTDEARPDQVASQS